jgi:hypothetical protein
MRTKVLAQGAKVLTLSKTLKRCFLVQNYRENTFLKFQDFYPLGQDFCPPGSRLLLLGSGLLSAWVRTFASLSPFDPLSIQGDTYHSTIVSKLFSLTIVYLYSKLAISNSQPKTFFFKRP